MRLTYPISIGTALLSLFVYGGQKSSVASLPPEIKIDNLKSSSNFALIPAGTFMMGDLSGQDGHSKPAHQVTISKPFLLQKTHVTVGQFKAFVGSTKYRTDAEKADGAYVWVGYWLQKSSANWRKPNFAQNDHHPVVCVTWNDAQAFIAWMNQEDPGKGYRLPTEAEWEYACRACTTDIRYGDLDSIAWYRDNSNSHTHPVGEKLPNAFELYDMNGNAYQWCQDWFDDNYYANSPTVDPQGPESSIYNYRVLRGGSWFTFHSDCRSSFRNRPAPDDRYNHYGFRLACSAPAPQ
jgi:formylglycine-generating enzyme required for sulfatase activity